MSLPCLSTPLHVPDVFSVCPLHFPCVSRSFFASHFPTSPVVPIGFLVLCFPFIPSVFAIRTSKNTEFFQIFGKRRQEPQTSKEPAGGIEPGAPVLRPAPRRLRLVERHQIAARSVGHPPPPCTPRIRRRAGGRQGGGVILYPFFLAVRHAEQCRRI